MAMTIKDDSAGVEIRITQRSNDGGKTYKAEFLLINTRPTDNPQVYTYHQITRIMAILDMWIHPKY